MKETLENYKLQTMILIYNLMAKIKTVETYEFYIKHILFKKALLDIKEAKSRKDIIKILEKLKTY